VTPPSGTQTHGLAPYRWKRDFLGRNIDELEREIQDSLGWQASKAHDAAHRG
jgi:hypothetical protein